MERSVRACACCACSVVLLSQKCKQDGASCPANQSLFLIFSLGFVWSEEGGLRLYWTLYAIDPLQFSTRNRTLQSALAVCIGQTTANSILTDFRYSPLLCTTEAIKQKPDPSSH